MDIVLQVFFSASKGQPPRRAANAICSAICLGALAINVRAAAGINTAPGQVSFFKHTTSADDSYTTAPSATNINFMNSQWLRLMTYSGYWNIGNKLSWYANAWGYLDSYAIYTNPANIYSAALIAVHPDWILRDASGNPLYINYACSGGICTQYAADITNPSGFRAA